VRRFEWRRFGLGIDAPLDGPHLCGS